MIIIWLLLYSLLFSFLKGNTLLIGLGIYSVCLYIYLVTKKRLKLYKLGLIYKKRLHYLVGLVPFLCIPICNLLYGEIVSRDKIEYSMFFITVIVSAMEELFFRGWLRTKIKGRYAIVITSIVFGVCHVINFIGHYDLVYVFIQVIFAFGFGICFYILTVVFDSLIPVIVLHGMINVSSMGMNIFSIRYWIIMLILMLLCVIYSLAFYKFCLTKEKL